MNESIVWNLFAKNWVYRLYTPTRFSLWKTMAVTGLLASTPFVLGGLVSLLLGVPGQYFGNWTPYLNTAGLALSLLSFAWYAHRLPSVLTELYEAFDVEEEVYIQTIQKWAGKIANNHWLMVVFSLPIAILNISETVEIWRSVNPPFLLAPWTQSASSGFFAFFYGMVHGVILPFLLGSGAVGLIGTLFLLGDIFNFPILLSAYRRVEGVIELIAWLVMWTLIALASISLFGRSLILFRTDIQAIQTSGIYQSILASVLVLVIGSIPFVLIRNSIVKAKRKELAELETRHQREYTSLRNFLDKYYVKIDEQPNQQNVPDVDQELQRLVKRYETVKMMMNDVEKIPSLPIHWPSIARISLGAIVSFGSSLASLADIMDWI